MDFSKVVRTIPDYPKKGIMFRDITTLLGNPQAFRRAVDELVQQSSLPVARVMAALSALELEGHICRYAGGYIHS